MKKNLQLFEPMGGIEKKYDKRIKELVFGSTAGLFSSMRLIGEWEKSGGVGAHIDDWLNGPLRGFDEIERELAEFEAKVMADPQYSDADKQKFQAQVVDDVRMTLERARALDRYVMTGEMSAS